MAIVRIEAQNQDGRTGWYDLSAIPPLGDERYIDSYNGAYGYAKIGWVTGSDFEPDTYWGFQWYVDGVLQAQARTNGPKTPRVGWREKSLPNFMIDVTDRVKDIGLTRLDVYYYADNIYTDEGNPYIEIDFEPKPIIVSNPSLSNVTLSRDKPITLTWTHSGSPQYGYEIKYIVNDVEKTIKVQSDKQSHTFAPGELPEGKIKYQIRLTNGFIESEWTSEKTFTTIANKVVSLEPDGVAQNKDKQIVVTWAGSEPYIQFEFEYKCNKETKLVTGTTGDSYAFPADFFDTETVSMKLRLYNGYIWSEWRTASFITYGKPETPTLTIQSEYNTATPTFTWESIGQVSYRLQVLKNDAVVLDSADVYSGTKEHTFATSLDNNTVYTARLRIKNQYEYASDWDAKEFKIAFNDLQKPIFDMFKDDVLGKVMFNIYNAEGQNDFRCCELYRREYGSNDWIKITTNLGANSTYVDYTCRSGALYEYKVTAISSTGGFTDSDIKLQEVRLKNTMISDTTDYNNYVVLIHNPKKSRVFAKEIHFMQYSGLTAPRLEFGDINYINMNISFTVDEKTLSKLLDLYYSNNTLLLRDNRGKKIYGHISSEPNVDDAEFMKYAVSFSFTENNFNEGI